MLESNINMLHEKLNAKNKCKNKDK